MRVITAFFSVEKLPLRPDQLPPVKEAIYRCREWLGTNEGRNRVAIFEGTSFGRPACQRPTLQAFHFSVLIEDHKTSKPSQG